MFWPERPDLELKQLEFLYETTVMEKCCSPTLDVSSRCFLPHGRSSVSTSPYLSSSLCSREGGTYQINTLGMNERGGHYSVQPLPSISWWSLSALLLQGLLLPPQGTRWELAPIRCGSDCVDVCLILWYTHELAQLNFYCSKCVTWISICHSLASFFYLFR